MGKVEEMRRGVLVMTKRHTAGLIASLGTGFANSCGLLLFLRVTHSSLSRSMSLDDCHGLSRKSNFLLVEYLHSYHVRAGRINHAYRERSAEELRLRTAILDFGCDFIKHIKRMPEKMREVIQQYGKQMKY